MSRTYYNVYQTAADFFKAAKAVSKAQLGCFEHSLETFADCENGRRNSFNGSWTHTCTVFDECTFKAEASLTDDIIDEICTTDFSEMKWKFMQQLEEGDSVDVERYLAGQERCWNGVRRVPKQRKAVRVYVNFGGNCGRSKEELAVAGAVGVTFAEIMESMGVSAEIWGVHFNHGMDAYGNDYVDMVKLKAQNEYSDLGLINFMLGDAGVFRNGFFRTWTAAAARNGFDTAFGLGQSRLCSLDMLGLTPAEQKSAVMVPQLFSVEDAKAWLARALRDASALQPAA